MRLIWRDWGSRVYVLFVTQPSRRVDAGTVWQKRQPCRAFLHHDTRRNHPALAFFVFQANTLLFPPSLSLSLSLSLSRFTVALITANSLLFFWIFALQLRFHHALRRLGRDPLPERLARSDTRVQDSLLCGPR